VLAIIVVVAFVLILVAGLWWTRGYGGLSGGVDDPARQELSKYTELGDPMPEPGADAGDREHDVE
jgi:hypothetical protein